MPSINIILTRGLSVIILGYDSRSGGRRPFGSGFRRDYGDDRREDNRGSGDRYGDRYGDREDRYERREERREDRGELMRLTFGSESLI